MENLIRVLVANRPRLIRELILTTLLDQPDIEIVGELADEADIPANIEKTNPDVVLIAQDKIGEGPSICDEVLLRRPEIRIIAVAPHHNYSVHYWASLNIYSRKIEASEEALLGVLRAKVTPICGLT
jgi:DNA-binding NarL/FixJ family response regulator